MSVWTKEGGRNEVAATNTEAGPRPRPGVRPSHRPRTARLRRDRTQAHLRGGAHDPGDSRIRGARSRSEGERS